MGRPRHPIQAGQRFGKWVVVEEGPPSRWNHPRWLCRCECGLLAVRYGSSLMLGRSNGCRRCGSLQHGATIGGSFSPEYKIWKGIIQRCHNPKCGGYPLYGARGIQVYSGWRGRGGYVAFLSAIGPKPGHGYEIDRINSNGNYEPGNVRWATRKEQAGNLRRNVFLTAFGKTQQISQWAEELKMSKSTIRMRLRRGRSAEEALTPTLVT
jgi:hypothetical protein